jgi:hypothetical protein
MNLGLFKFKHGEEMICEYLDKGTHYYVQNTAGMIPNEDFSWNLVTWMPYTNATHGLDLPKDNVWFVVNLSKDMAEYYVNWKETLHKLRQEKEQ